MKPTPRLALSVASTPSFIFKRIESLMQWGKDPFHPRRGQLAGVAVCLGIVAVMVALFGQPMRSSQETAWKYPVDWRAEALMYDFDRYGHGQYVRTDAPRLVMTYPRFYVNGQMDLQKEMTFTCRNVCALYLEDYGLFTFSLSPFSNAKPIGTLQDQHLTFDIDGLSVKLVSMYHLLPNPKYRGKTMPVYAKHDAQYDFGRLNRKGPGYKWARYYNGSQGEVPKNMGGWGLWNKDFVIYNYALLDFYRYEGLYHQDPKPALSFGSIDIELNGQKLANAMCINPVFLDISMKDDDIVEISRTNSDESFAFSFLPFEGASQIAHVEGNEITVQTPAGLLKVQSVEDILHTRTGTIWFAYHPLTRKFQTPIQNPFYFIRMTRNVYMKQNNAGKRNNLFDSLISKVLGEFMQK